MISKSQVKLIASLHQKKFRKEHGLFLVEGEKACYELLKAGWPIEYALLTEKFAKEKFPEWGRTLKFETVTRRDMEKMSALSTPPEILCVAAIARENFDSWVLKTGLTLVLDGIKDPGNMGTIIRVADWFGIKNIVCSNDCVDAYSPKTVQSAMGSLFRVNIFYTDIEMVLRECSEHKIPVFGAVLEGENIYKAELASKGLIVIGSESHGIRRTLHQYISKKITIPSFVGKKENKPESLNAAMATAIICGEFRRRM